MTELHAVGNNRPPHKPTEKLRNYVKNASAMKHSQRKIAEDMKLDVKTLRKYYRKELDSGKNEIPRLAVNKIRSYLKKDFSDSKDRHAQATLAEKVMKSHGWSEKLDLGGLTALPGIIIKKIPEDPNDA